MQQRKNYGFKIQLLIFLLIFWKHCNSQMHSEEDNTSPEGPEAEGGAFFALRSCHQMLQGYSGEFFSPDYLCSNPPLWCNWTIKVDPGKRIHLHLEDLTPDDTCHLKQDQVHVDEPVGLFPGHKVLQKCWKEAKFTSFSNTLYVVLLIGGRPGSPYRGFTGRYQAFGPPVFYDPLQEFTLRNRKLEPSAGANEFEMNREHVESDSQDYSQRVNPDQIYDYYDQHADMTPELPWEEKEQTDNEPLSFTQVDEHQQRALVNYSHIHPITAGPTVLTSTQESSRSGRGADSSDQSEPAESSQHNQISQPTRTPTTIQMNIETDSKQPEEAAVSEEENRKVVSVALDQPPPPSEGPEPEEPEPTHRHPNMVEQLSDHRGNYHLFEVAVEVHFQQDLEESSEKLSMSLQQPIKAVVIKKLEALHSLLSVSFKRVKRISVGALCILWLQIRQRPGDLQLRRAVDSLQQLTTTPINIRGRAEIGVIMSMSIADVNECGTQLVMCDVNADCKNHFGTYECRCRSGFRDASRVGTGGSVCADVKEAGCSSGLSSETKVVYVLSFLLSCLILLLLGAAGTLYHRHHQGAFLIRCHSNISHHDPNNNNNNHHRHEGDPDLTPLPPPPPAWSFREGWPQVKECLPPVDLPLLRFSPLLQPDGYTEPQEGKKM
uniref:Uncharacterized LOC109988225 n=1 Tax=Labrus bergylta TaxID=56723 RepID=A0A3Q3E7B0_9LABR